MCDASWKNKAPVFRLAKVLSARKNAVGSFSKLSREIHAAWLELTGKESTRPIIDRRKVRAICSAGDRLVLSLDELYALNAYLERFDESLARRPVFEKPSLLQAFAEGDRVVFLLGSKVHDRRVDLSQWDVKSVAEIQREVDRVSTNVHFDLHDVLLEEEVEKARASFDEPWAKFLESGGPSVVCIGSPRACHAAELMLSTMWGETPLEAAETDDPVLPFHFVRPSVQEQFVPSRFVWHENDIKDRDSAVARRVAEDQVFALCIGEEVHLADAPGKKPSRTFGVVVLQRRPNGAVWMVVAGLTGAATHAAALSLKEHSFSLPPASSDKPSPVLWFVIQAVVEEDARHPDRGVHHVVNHWLHGPEKRWPA